MMPLLGNMYTFPKHENNFRMQMSDFLQSVQNLHKHKFLFPKHENNFRLQMSDFLQSENHVLQHMFLRVQQLPKRYLYQGFFFVPNIHPLHENRFLLQLNHILLHEHLLPHLQLSKDLQHGSHMNHLNTILQGFYLCYLYNILLQNVFRCVFQHTTCIPLNAPYFQ